MYVSELYVFVQLYYVLFERLEFFHLRWAFHAIECVRLFQGGLFRSVTSLKKEKCSPSHASDEAFDFLN